MPTIRRDNTPDSYIHLEVATTTRRDRPKLPGAFNDEWYSKSSAELVRLRFNKTVRESGKIVEG